MSDESSSIATEESAPEENSAGASPLSEAAPVDPVVTLTNDLQRLQAEYQNYRKRVERDRVQRAHRARCDPGQFPGPPAARLGVTIPQRAVDGVANRARGQSPLQFLA